MALESLHKWVGTMAMNGQMKGRRSSGPEREMTSEEIEAAKKQDLHVMIGAVTFFIILCTVFFFGVVKPSEDYYKAHGPCLKSEEYSVGPGRGSRCVQWTK